MQDPYKILGISPPITKAKLKRAWLKKASELHPDAGGDATFFKEARWAYEFLRQNAGRAELVGRPEAVDPHVAAAQYVDAWLRVPARFRFLFGMLKAVHFAALYFAQPLFFGGGILLLAVLVLGKWTPKAWHLVKMVAIGGIITVPYYCGLWGAVRIRLRDWCAAAEARQRTRRTMVAYGDSVPVNPLADDVLP